MTSAGYSGTPLWKKLGLKPGMRAAVLHADPGWSIPLDDGPDVEWTDEGPSGLILAFYREAAAFLSELDDLGGTHPPRRDGVGGLAAESGRARERHLGEPHP
ncbi:hypothetical protein ACF1AJ_16090 [Leifsonia sp. NPDC014704]|uniref:hypothetical protein n=1 Tax=Leifsonia sp. NPDC014704 TaxID=3364123 RepID=UPI0036F4A646